MNTVKNIKELLSTIDYRDFDNLAEYVYLNYFKDIKTNDAVLTDFITLMEWSFKTDRSFDIKYFTPEDSDYKEQFDKAMGILKPNVENLIEQNLEDYDFYVNIWNTFTNPAMFANDRDKIGALIFLLSYDKVPYFKLDKPVEVTEKEFDELFEKLNMKIQKSLFIFNRGYELRTDMASQLLRVLDSESDEKNRVVLLTCMLHYLEWVTEKA